MRPRTSATDRRERVFFIASSLANSRLAPTHLYGGLASGRMFLSGDPLIQDPVNGQSYNRYSYVLNNPTNLTDPTGFAAACDPSVPHVCGGMADREETKNKKEEKENASETRRLQNRSDASGNRVPNAKGTAAAPPAASGSAGVALGAGAVKGGVAAAPPADAANSPAGGPHTVSPDQVAAAVDRLWNGQCGKTVICGTAPLPGRGGLSRAQVAEGELEAAAKSAKSGVPGPEFVPSEAVTAPYARPSGAGPTAAQRASVQGKPCVDCGALTSKQVADHIDPLVVQYYRTGSVNVSQQSSLEAVQPHCPSCSASQGGQLGVFGKLMKDLFGF